jgi:proline racemase
VSRFRGGTPEEAQEVTLPADSRDSLRSLIVGVERSAREILRQAPAARMVGEFAVKMLVREVNRRAGTVRDSVVVRHRGADKSPSGTPSPWPPPVPPVG